MSDQSDRPEPENIGSVRTNFEETVLEAAIAVEETSSCSLMAVMLIHKPCLWDETVLLFCGWLELFSVWTLQLVGTDGGGSLKMSDVTVLHMNYFGLCRLSGESSEGH